MGPESEKKTIRKRSATGVRKRSPKGAKREPKWSQRATTMHQKSQASEKVAKIIEKGCSRECFWGSCWDQKSIKNYKKSIRKSMPKKLRKMMPKWTRNGPKMHQKSMKNESQKNDEFSMVAGGMGTFRRSASINYRLGR